MKVFPWQGKVLALCLLVAFAFNAAHYAVFRDGNYIAMFILAQLGFLPVSVYLVTVVVNQLLGRREKQAMLKKLNMVIGSFFSEVGTDLLRRITDTEPDKRASRTHLLVGQEWGRSEYHRARARLKEESGTASREAMDWESLRSFLTGKRSFLLSLLGNPNLLEHESFTDLLWAVFHLAEELGSRDGVSSLPESDHEHLLGDIRRVDVLLSLEWLAYMQHLQEDYPYLFSLAVRTNPFDPDARVEVV
jgi:hypothetical protein